MSAHIFKFNTGDKVTIRAIPVFLTAFRKSLKKLIGQPGTIVYRENRQAGEQTGNYYHVTVEGKEIVLHELNLEKAR